MALGKNKKILVPVVVVFLIILCSNLSGCDKKEVYSDDNSVKKDEPQMNFPLRENGYPKNDVVMINEKVYPLERYNATDKSFVEYTEINLELSKADDEIEVILPRNVFFYTWNIEDKEGINLFSYNVITLPVKKDEILEGEESDLESFAFNVAPNINQILFKLIDEKERGKSFNDKQQSYLLKVNLYRK